MKGRKVCNKTRSPPASLLFKGQGIELITKNGLLTGAEGTGMGSGGGGARLKDTGTLGYSHEYDQYDLFPVV